MAKLIQICASQNDLFGLDGDGVVYQYNFNTKNWIKLGEGPTDSTQPQSERRSAKERRSRPS
jgi:hypothetical protein